MLTAFCLTATVTLPVSADNYTPEKKLQALFFEANKNIANDKGAILADSLTRLAVSMGDKNAEVLGLYVKMKHECTKSDNVAGMEKSVKAVMDKALKYNMIEYFYSAVSFKVTYYTNLGECVKALEYQEQMLKFAIKHNHPYGINMGHISMGNLYRMRLQMPQAIHEYELAIEGYKKFKIEHDNGLDYKRIVECYIIDGNFRKAITAADKGLSASKYERSIGGLYGYKAFALFMLNRDNEFKECYNRFTAYKNSNPDILPFIKNCLEAMNAINNGDDKKAKELLDKSDMGAFKEYVKVARDTRNNKYDKALKSMMKIYANRYGDSKGSYSAAWGRMSAKISDNMKLIDKQRAEYENSLLELKKSNLELRNTDLELQRAKNEESLAQIDAETKRLMYANRKMAFKRLKASLKNQQLQQKAMEQKRKTERIIFATLIAATVLLIAIACFFLARNRKITSKLQATNNKLKNTLNDLSLANEKAQESDRKKTVFIQNMSHEVRTPLNSIVGFSQMLAEEGLDDDSKKYMAETINSSSEILNNMINDILDLTSIESGRYAIKMEETYSNEICRKAIEETRHRNNGNVELKFCSSLPESYKVTTDKFRAKQVIENMLTNAMKNTAKGSITLECSLGNVPGMLSFTVTDTGCGVPKDKQEEIFERFSKLDKFKQGVGLGLSICRAIAGKLGGSINIDKDYEGGARFCFNIPAHL